MTSDLKKPGNIVKDRTYEYYRLDPIPKNEELMDFYRREYVKKAGLAARPKQATLPPLTSKEKKLNDAWTTATIYEEIAEPLKRLMANKKTGRVAGKKILEVGCGRGALLAHLRKNGFAVEGIEPSQAFGIDARKRGITVHDGMFASVVEREGWLGRKNRRKFDAMIFSNVLEHVMDPQACLELSRKLLAPGGFLVVRVPNDFSEIQLAALAASKELKKKQPWWICPPDHVSYFNFESLQRLLEAKGFDICHRSVDFPMELFLLMGENYVDDPVVGRQAHRQRRQFEMNLPVELRRKLYKALAGVGIGRNILVVAKNRA